MKTCLIALFLCAASLLPQAMAATPADVARKSFQETKIKAEKGDAAAQFNLGEMYADGEGVPTDEAEAAKWCRKAADQGYAEAQVTLGQMYFDGEGVPKNKAEAVKWLRKAADQGDVKAQFFLGLMYADGEGVPKDAAEAVKWYRKAADQGHASTQSNLGVMYAYGRGVPKDEAEAVKWFRKAADQGNAKAQSNLGGMYGNGQGVPKDKAEAYKWFLLAGAQGDEDAKNNISIIELVINPAQKAEGQRRAREWKPRKPWAVGSPVPRRGIAQARPAVTGGVFCCRSVLLSDRPLPPAWPRPRATDLPLRGARLDVHGRVVREIMA